MNFQSRLLLVVAFVVLSMLLITYTSSYYHDDHHSGIFLTGTTTDLPTVPPLPTNSSLNHLEMPDWMQKQRERQERLRRFCRTQPKETLMKSYSDPKKLHNWIYSDKVGVVYCSVPKVACTTWKKIFQVFYGYYNHTMDIKISKDEVHNLRYQTFTSLSAKNAGLKTQMYYNFIIARNPLERVVSAYRNKLEKPFGKYFQKAYGSKILWMFRKNLTTKEYKEGKGVTFIEFVDYILHTSMEELNEHWQGICYLCSLCGVKYDFIADMNTLYDDSDIVLKQLGWYDRVQFPRGSKDTYKKAAVDLTPEYLNRLSDKQLDGLHKKYIQDFLAFGYEYNLKQIRAGII